VVEQERRWLPQARRAIFEVYRRETASVWIEASSESMQPLIRPGTWMLVEFGATPTGLGEVVLFPLGEMAVAHRVVARRYQQDIPFLITKGDAEPYCDPALYLADVLGVVRALRYGPEGPMISIGCTGYSARTIGQISRWSGRSGRLARRTAPLLPDSLRRMVLCAIPSCIRIVTQALLAPLHWVAWIQTKLYSFTLQKKVGNP
jgi:hypothetical protein